MWTFYGSSQSAKKEVSMNLVTLQLILIIQYSHLSHSFTLFHFYTERNKTTSCSHETVLLPMQSFFFNTYLWINTDCYHHWIYLLFKMSRKSHQAELKIAAWKRDCKGITFDIKLDVFKNLIWDTNRLHLQNIKVCNIYRWKNT